MCVCALKFNPTQPTLRRRLSRALYSTHVAELLWTLFCDRKRVARFFPVYCTFPWHLQTTWNVRETFSLDFLQRREKISRIISYFHVLGKGCVRTWNTVSLVFFPKFHAFFETWKDMKLTWYGRFPVSRAQKFPYVFNKSQKSIWNPWICVLLSISRKAFYSILPI